MGAVALSPEGKRELAELRSRAYGPAADIHLDDGAVARLQELEELARVELPSPGAEPSPMPEESVPAQQATTISSSEESADASRTAVSDGVPTAVPTSIWWRRFPLWAIAAVAVVVAAVSLAVPHLLPSSADATLPITDDAGNVQIQPRELLEWYNLDRESLRRHEDFHGVKVWSATNSQGSTCLLLSVDANWTDASCTPAGLAPVLDMVIYDGMRPLDGLDLATGSVVRFELRGDAVEVSVAPVEENAQAPQPSATHFVNRFV